MACFQSTFFEETEYALQKNYDHYKFTNLDPTPDPVNSVQKCALESSFWVRFESRIVSILSKPLGFFDTKKLFWGDFHFTTKSPFGVFLLPFSKMRFSCLMGPPSGFSALHEVFWNLKIVPDKGVSKLGVIWQCGIDRSFRNDYP